MCLLLTLRIHIIVSVSTLFCLLWLFFKILQFRILKLTGIREFEHPLYPKKFGLQHHMHFSQGQASGRDQDENFIISEMIKQHPKENQVIIWVSPITPMILVYGGEELKTILKRNTIEKVRSVNFLKIDKSVLTCPMAEHRKIRKMIQPAFNKNSLQLFSQKANHHLRYFVQKLSNLTSQSLDLQKLAHLLFLDITCDTSLGQNLESQKTNKSGNLHPLMKNLEMWENNSFAASHWMQVKAPIVILFECLYKYNDWFLSKIAKSCYEDRKSAIEFIQNYVDVVIRNKVTELKNSSKDNSIHQISNFSGSRIRETCLINELMSDYMSGNINNETVQHQIMAFILAGTDTNSYTFAADIHYLGNNLNLQNELRNEINYILQENCDLENLENFNLQLEDLDKFVKVKAFVRELLRIYNPIPVIWKQKMYSMFGIPILAPIMIKPHAVHTDPRFWKNPKKLDITRWLDSKILHEKLPSRNPSLIETNMCLPISRFQRVNAIASDKILLSTT